MNVFSDLRIKLHAFYNNLDGTFTIQIMPSSDHLNNNLDLEKRVSTVSILSASNQANKQFGPDYLCVAFKMHTLRTDKTKGSLPIPVT